MKYNFDEIIDRKNTEALNIEGFRQYMFSSNPDIEFQTSDDKMVRMWVADMEFAVAPEILDAMKARIDRKIFGYTMVYTDEFYNIFSKWCKDRYDWSFPKEQLTFTPGIIPALYELVGDITKEDEKVLILTPSYGYFKHACKFNNRQLVCSDLKCDNGEFTIDFEDFEKKASDPKVRLVIWCNPHNPTGRVWSSKEAERIAEIVEKYQLWIISDEIHCDILRSNVVHTPMAKIMPEYKKLITCMAASKTFNMAGMMFSSIIIRDLELKALVEAHDKSFGCVNPISLTATEAAYEKGWPWLVELRKYLDDNFEYVRTFLNKNLPKSVFKVPEATYLAWVDLSAYLDDVEDLPTFFAKEAGVLLEGGDRLFVGNAKGYIRLNLAMPKEIIVEGMNRILRAIRKPYF